MEHGKHTAELGRSLKKRIESSGRRDVEVFFDHGETGKSDRVVPYFGHYGTSTTLAFVDLAIVNTDTKSVLVLCEIEEEGANPKKVIGDCFNIFISDFVCIGRKQYDPSGAHLLLGVRVEAKGRSSEKITNLRKRIKASVKEEFLKGIELEFVTVHDYASLVSRLETKICEILDVQQREGV